MVKKGAQNWFTWILQEAADYAYRRSCVVQRGAVAD